MSKVISEQLLAGVIFGDLENDEFIYLPGGEVGSEPPLCVLECRGSTEDLGLWDASEMVLHLALRPCAHPLLGRKSY